MTRGRGQPGTENPGHANAVGGGHVRPERLREHAPAAGNVAEPQICPGGSTAQIARALTL